MGCERYFSSMCRARRHLALISLNKECKGLQTCRLRTLTESDAVIGVEFTRMRERIFGFLFLKYNDVGVRGDAKSELA